MFIFVLSSLCVFQFPLRIFFFVYLSLSQSLLVFLICSLYLTCGVLFLFRVLLIVRFFFPLVFVSISLSSMAVYALFPSSFYFFLLFPLCTAASLRFFLLSFLCPSVFLPQIFTILFLSLLSFLFYHLCVLFQPHFFSCSLLPSGSVSFSEFFFLFSSFFSVFVLPLCTAVFSYFCILSSLYLRSSIMLFFLSFFSSYLSPLLLLYPTSYNIFLLSSSLFFFSSVSVSVSPLRFSPSHLVPPLLPLCPTASIFLVLFFPLACLPSHVLRFLSRTQT